MKAMILAAGDGKRMRPLTNNCPKALIEVKGKPLIVYQIESLARAGVKQLIINHGRMGFMIENCLGDGQAFGVTIQYSAEGDAPLETGGGIKHALPLLGRDPFIVVNADVWTDYDYSSMTRPLTHLARLVMVDNPEHHQQGDFNLHDGLLSSNTGTRYTFSGIGVYSPDLFLDYPDATYPLAPLLIQAMEKGQLAAEHYSGVWMDIGNPERLDALNQSL
jgi:MurNAc alpha-1-phosphate uridylyltransferase